MLARIRSFESYKLLGLVVYTLNLKYPRRRKSTNLGRLKTTQPLMERRILEVGKNDKIRNDVIRDKTRMVDVKAELHIRKFLENSRERYARIGEQVMRGSVYSYILAIRLYAPNTLLALPNLLNRRILANTVYESQFSRSLICLCENAREC